MEAENPRFWQELKSTDADQMIDELLRYKQAHYAADRRRILLCGIIDGKIRVEWLAPAESGVDVAWETRLYSLIRAGNRPGAIRFLQQTRKLSRTAAARRIQEMAAKLGMR
jgi:hypothetical protein